MVTSMLEKAIEIEGLLRIIRDGNPLPETYILLNRKTAELARQAAGIEKQEHEPELDSAKADFVMAAAPQKEQPQEVMFSIPSPQADPEKESASEAPSFAPAHDLELSEEDDIILEFDDSAEAEFNEEAPAPAGTAEETEASELLSVETETTYENPHAVETNGGSGIAAASKQARQTKLKSAFSLNDRFLYARELFNGNMKMFDSTLDFLEGIEDYTVIEDYFYSELEWDPERPYVAEFMEILRPHFKE